MEITNRANLPSPLVSAVSTGNYRPKEKRLSVTTLINPPQLESLRRKYWDELKEDAANRIWMLFGSAMHQVLESTSVDNALIEEKLEFQVGDYTVSGVADLLMPLDDGGYVVSDWKLTSVWSFLHGVKPEWQQQLQIYAYIYQQTGFDVRKAQVISILRDWSQNKAKYDSNYPDTQVHILPVTLLPSDQAQRLIEERVALHRNAIEDDDYADCTPEERWAKPDTWAVKKPGGKRAIRVFPSEWEALDFMDADKHEIEFRPGENMRCNSYCPVSNFCRQHKLST